MPSPLEIEAAKLAICLCGVIGVNGYQKCEKCLTLEAAEQEEK